MHNVLTHILSGPFIVHYHQLYSEITQFMKLGARKKVALFVNRHNYSGLNA